jgi:hypothetical protein
MRVKTQVAALLTLGLLSVAMPSLATVLTFDDLSGYLTPVPSTYDGFNFSSWLIDSTCSGTSATGACTTYPYQPQSLPTSIFTESSTNSISSVSHTPFVFNGAYFTGYSGVTEAFQLYLGGTLVATSPTLTLNGSEVPAFLSTGYSGNVDTIVLVSNALDSAVMDNFTYNGTTPVPIPAAGWLLLSALGGVGLMMRRRREHFSASPTAA